MELVSGGDPPLADEEDALLLVRLRAVAILLTAGLVLVLVRDLMFRRGPAWQLQAAETVAMASLAVLLSSVRSGTARGLKAAEAATFGLAAGVMASRLWHDHLAGSARGDATALTVGSRDAVIGTTIVLLTYALMVPAPRRRAWRAIAAIAACPVAAEMLLFLVHPEVFRMARRVEVAERVGETISLLAIVAALAGYGSHLCQHHARPGPRGPAVQPVPAPGRDRRRRHGRGLPRRAPAAEAALRRQADPPGRGPATPGRWRGSSARSADGPALAPEHRRDLRLRPDRGRHASTTSWSTCRA